MDYDYKAIGEILKKERLKHNRELKDIADDIKITESYLEAVENGEPRELPSLVYYRLFVRSYATELGLDSEELFNELARPEGTVGDEKADTRRSSKQEGGADGEKKSGLKLVLWSGAAVVAVAVILYFALLGGRDEPGASEGLAGNQALADSAAAAAADSAEALPEPIPPIALDINISETSWILVMSDGDTVLNRNLEPGATRYLEADENFIISLGNPKGVELRMDGTPLRPLSSSGRPVRDLELNRDNVKDFYLIPEVGTIERN
jgi:transcriptional regulator with XRE-family HTH domain